MYLVTRSDEEIIGVLRVCQDVLGIHGIRFNINDIRGPKRDADLVFIRALISAYLRRRGYSMWDIARILNKASHATISNLLNHKPFEKFRELQYQNIVATFKSGANYVEIEAEIAKLEARLKMLRLELAEMPKPAVKWRPVHREETKLSPIP